MRQKRYQYYSSEGIKWTKWFNTTDKDNYKWQMKGKLLNEYREI